MPKLEVFIPAETKDRIEDAFAGLYKYQPTIVDAQGNQVENPETKTQFTRRYVIQFMKDVVKSWEAQKAADAARMAAAQKAEDEVTLS